jgi:aminopeptidase N
MVTALGLPAVMHAQIDIGARLGQALRKSLPDTPPDADAQNAREWCDSTVVAAAAGERRQIPIVACTMTPADSLAVRRAITAVARALPLYGRLTGVPYPWPRYAMQFQPADGVLGMGGQTTGPGTMRYRGPLPDVRVERDRPDVTAKILVHELAHQWFTEYVQGAGHSGWLFEGFADFMTAQAWAAEHGPRVKEEFLFFYNTGWSQVYTTDPASHSERTFGAYAPTGLFSIPWSGATIWDGALDSDDDLYYRGALTLWMLQRSLGEAPFWASVKTYLTDNAHQTADATDFLRAIQTTTGKDLTWFFQQWVYGHGYPRVTVSSAYDAAAHRVTLQVVQDPPTFRLPVAIRVGTADGDIVTQAVIDSAHQTLVINNVRQPPTFVVFDDADAIVKTLRFAQPTAWLVAALHREATPWQTWWTIEQLRGRAAHDSAAATALMAEVRQGKYPLTRAQAAVALEAVHTREAVATLSQALQDTAVLVRRGTVQGLDAIGTPAALAALTSAFQHDPSDIVRFDAIAALLRNPAVPVTAQRTLLTDALRQSSYREVVRFGALLSLIGPNRDCDSAKVAMVRTLIHDPTVGPAVTNGVAAVNRLFMSFGPACLQALTPVTAPDTTK